MVYTVDMIDSTTSEASPQKKAFLALALVLALTAAVGFMPASWLGINPAKKKLAKIDLSNLTSVSDLAKDTNGDGVTDWNEIIAQTYDGAGLAEAVQPDPSAVAQLSDPNNLTGSLSKNFYLASAYIKQSGVDSQGSEQDIVNNLIKNEASKIVLTAYTFQDLETDSKETTTSVKTYGNALGKLMTIALEARLGLDDVSYLKNYVDTKSKASFETLVDKRDAANNIVSGMLTLKVPLSASAYHLVTLNRVAAYRDTMDNILKMETDPVRSAIAFDMYLQVTTDMLETARLFSNYFLAKDITFSAKDSGYVFDPSYTIK
jgi:hypothetical protein